MNASHYNVDTINVRVERVQRIKTKYVLQHNDTEFVYVNYFN